MLSVVVGVVCLVVRFRPDPRWCAASCSGPCRRRRRPGRRDALGPGRGDPSARPLHDPAAAGDRGDRGAAPPAARHQARRLARLTFALLSGLVLAAYAALVVVLSGLASALVAALLALPLRNRLQAAVDRRLYGERGDPLRVARRVGRSSATGCPRRSRRSGRRSDCRTSGSCSTGGPSPPTATAPEPTVTLPLARGDIVVGLRHGETSRWARPTPVSSASSPGRCRPRCTPPCWPTNSGRRASASSLLARTSAAACAVTCTTGSGRSSPASRSPPTRRRTSPPVHRSSRERLDGIRSDTRTAIQEVRRILDDLGSPALDELGLVEALRLRAEQGAAARTGPVACRR